LLIPYLAWTAIYMLARLAKHLSTYVWPDSVGDWLQLVCFGGAALHLYFLPALMAGTALSFALAPLARRLRWGWLPLLGAVALLPFAGMIHQAAFRLLVAPLPENLLIRIVALAADTLPYILVAFGSLGFVKKYEANPSGRWGGALMLGAGLTLALSAGYAPVPGLEPILTPLCGCLVFFGSLFLSGAFPDRPWLTRLGRAVFGVYLVHHLLIEGFEMVANRYHSSWLETYHRPQILVMTLLVFTASVVLSVGFQERIWPRFTRRPA
jgi:peptidoglycan/LPS O-acetylase OafA/YrhL